jgi:hypothetical protein
MGFLLVFVTSSSVCPEGMSLFQSGVFLNIDFFVGGLQPSFGIVLRIYSGWVSIIFCVHV